MRYALNRWDGQDTETLELDEDVAVWRWMAVGHLEDVNVWVEMRLNVEQLVRMLGPTAPRPGTPESCVDRFIGTFDSEALLTVEDPKNGFIVWSMSREVKAGTAPRAVDALLTELADTIRTALPTIDASGRTIELLELAAEKIEDRFVSEDDK